jgi:hypothetical protein
VERKLVEKGGKSKRGEKVKGEGKKKGKSQGEKKKFKVKVV